MQKNSMLLEAEKEIKIRFENGEIFKANEFDTYDEPKFDDIFDYLSFTATKVS